MQQPRGLFACHAPSPQSPSTHRPSRYTRRMKGIMINVVILRLKCSGWQLVRLLASDTRIPPAVAIVIFRRLIMAVIKIRNLRARTPAENTRNGEFPLHAPLGASEAGRAHRGNGISASCVVTAENCRI